MLPNYLKIVKSFVSAFLNLPAETPAPNFAQTKRGANGKFLPKPLFFHLRHPNSKTNQPKFWQILSPKNSFAKTSSALKPHARGACHIICFGNGCELGTIETPSFDRLTI